MLSVFMPLCVCTELPLQYWGVWRFGDGVCAMCFPTFQHAPAYMFVCFPPPTHTGFPDLCVCLAAAGQLINQIFKQRSSCSAGSPRLSVDVGSPRPSHITCLILDWHRHIRSMRAYFSPPPPPWLSALLPTFRISSFVRCVALSLSLHPLFFLVCR